MEIKNKGYSLAKLLCRPEETYQSLQQQYPQLLTSLEDDVQQQIELSCKYEGYIKKQEAEILRHQHLEEIPIPKTFSFNSVKGLRAEALEKLEHYQPTTLGIASRIAGVSPADISILLVCLKRH